MKLKSLNTNYWSGSSPMRNVAEVDKYQHKHFRPRPFEWNFMQQFFVLLVWHNIQSSLLLNVCVGVGSDTTTFLGWKITNNTKKLYIENFFEGLQYCKKLRDLKSMYCRWFRCEERRIQFFILSFLFCRAFKLTLLGSYSILKYIIVINRLYLNGYISLFTNMYQNT